jgi:hypothetical protein
VRPHNQGPWLITQDFYFNNTFPWTPIDHEGVYDVGVTAWSEATQQTSPAAITVTVNPRVTSGTPVVNTTQNPLVAFYSAPPCSAPATMRVQFQASFTGPGYTASKPCTGLSMNFYVAGMLASSTYALQHQIINGSSVTYGPKLSFTTGSIPSSIIIPNHFTISGPTPPNSVNYPYMLHASSGESPYATDLYGNVVWFSEQPPYNSGYIVHPVVGGTFLAIEDDWANSRAICGSYPPASCGDHQYLREYDMAGNLIKQTSWSVVNDSVNAIRAKQGRPLVRLNSFSHEAIRLPNGYTVTAGTNEQVKQTSSGTQDVFGDTVIVLDQQFQPVWAWDAFDYFDINRRTIVSNCNQGTSAGCPQEFLQKQPNGAPYTTAMDWTHMNAIDYDPRDGNLLVSLRHQSWVVKISYNNGAGDGHVIWRLGYGGDFALANGYPVTDWFSGQHDARFQANGLLTLFDNNNASTVTQQPGGTAHGQAWRLDTTNMIATPIQNFDLGVVSVAVGSAALLSNGNYHFQAGFIGVKSTQDFEFTPSGTLVYKDQSDLVTYRSWRMQDLYTPSN